VERIPHLYRWYALSMTTVLVVFPLYFLAFLFEYSLPKIGSIPIQQVLSWVMAPAFIAGMIFLWRLAGALGKDRTTCMLCSIVLGPVGLAIVFAVLASTVRARCSNGVA